MRLICRALCSGALRLHVKIWYTYCTLLIKPFERCLVLIRLGGADSAVDLSQAEASSASKHGSGFLVACAIRWPSALPNTPVHASETRCSQIGLALFTEFCFCILLEARVSFLTLVICYFPLPFVSHHFVCM